MDEDEFEEIEDDGEADEEYVLAVTPEHRKGNKWGILAAALGLLKNVAESFNVFFFQLQVLAQERTEWQNDRQTFFEETSKAIETLTKPENSEVKDALPGE